MSVTAFELDRGTQHGRLASVDAPAGAYVFELGHSGLISESFTIGDSINIHQDITAQYADSAERLLRLTALLQCPAVATSGVSWQFDVVLTVAATPRTFYSRVISADSRELTLLNIGVSLASIPDPGTGTLTLSLTLVAA